MFTGFCWFRFKVPTLYFRIISLMNPYLFKEKRINPNSDEIVDINFSNRYYLSRTVSKNWNCWLCDTWQVNQSNTGDSSCDLRGCRGWGRLHSESIGNRRTEWSPLLLSDFLCPQNRRWKHKGCPRKEVHSGTNKISLNIADLQMWNY